MTTPNVKQHGLCNTVASAEVQRNVAREISDSLRPTEDHRRAIELLSKAAVLLRRYAPPNIEWSELREEIDEWLLRH